MIDVEIQLTDEMDRALCGPVLSLLAAPLLAEQIRDQIGRRAADLAAQLCSEDDRLAAETVVDVLGLLWPHGVSDPAWWRTPVGKMCARSLGRDDTESVTHSTAAAMLGVTRGTVAQLVARGTLARHADGGVARSSVLERLGR